MKLTHHHINKCVSIVTMLPVEVILSASTKRKVTDARNLAMLMCKKYLKHSTLKLARNYQKESHTTIMGDLKSAANLIETNAAAAKRAADVDELIKLHLVQIQKSIQRKDLNYRIRQKGIIIDTKAKTISIPPERVEEIKRSIPLMKELGYEIQYSII